MEDLKPNTTMDHKAPKSQKPTVEETIQYFSDNINPVRDCIYVNVPTVKEIEKLATTQSGLIIQGKGSETSYNEFLYTILATGDNQSIIAGSETFFVGNSEPQYKAGDKIYLKVKNLEQQMIEGHVFAIVSPFQVIAKKK